MIARVACLAVMVAGAGCGGSATTLPGPSDVTGRFSGTTDTGIGVAVDFGAYDSTTEAIRAALDTPAAWSIGLVSIVNRSNDLQPIPALFVTRPNGRVQRLARATVIRRADTGAKQELPAPGPLVPQQGALSLYVVFRGRPSDVRRLEMRVGVGPIVELTPQKSSGSRAGGG
jgi:hypothetical protein